MMLLAETDVAAAGRQVRVHVLREIQQERHFLLVFGRSRLRAETIRSIAQIVILHRAAKLQQTTINKSISVSQRSFRKPGTMGTLASPSEIGVWVQAFRRV